MSIQEIENTPGVSYLDENLWDEVMQRPLEKILPDEFTNLPAEFKAEIFDALSHLDAAELHFDDSSITYHSFLQKTLHLDQHNPNIVSAHEHNSQKAVAHALLAFAGLTEKESHLISLWDTRSIIVHALHLYQKGLSPWFDFATTDDVSSKSAGDVSHKESAPLFRSEHCPTLFDFFSKVIPAIYKIRSEDPNAAMKIFPQSKNVEAFNLGIKRNQDGSIIFTIEWYPGAYTPRDGDEDGKKHFIKNRSVSKEQRIVRAIIQFDQNGHAIVGLKPQKDADGNNLPFNFPTQPVAISELFSRAEIEGNHDDMTSTNNPFIFLKYIATHPQFNNLFTKFQKVHAQLGYVDLVLSGMIGPDTIFAIDMDYETPKEFSHDHDYLAWAIEQNKNLSPIPYSQLLDNLLVAPVVHEIDLIEVINFYHDLSTVFEGIETQDSYYKSLNSLASHLGLLELVAEKDGEKTVEKIHIPMLTRTSEKEFDPTRLLSQRQLEILISVIKFHQGKRPFFITPRQMDVLQVKYPSLYYPYLFLGYRDVASL